MTDLPSNDVIFEEAMGKPTREERDAYLAEACQGNERLRRRMVRLIEASLAASHFLETPVTEASRLAELFSSTAFEIQPENGSDVRAGLPRGLLAPSQRVDSLGRLGSLEVLELVARGSMGIVLRGFDEMLHRNVAIKLLPPEIASDAASRRRFVREARRAASVLHDNVIAIYAVDDSGSLPYIVMPFIEGSSLQERIKQNGPMPVEAILRLGTQIAAGLDAIHSRDLVHRDLKPANILIEGSGERVKITDFGVARAVDDPHATQLGLITGTPAYMSPEQAGGLSVDHRGDLFSLGSVLYAMSTGRPPFDGETIVGVIRKVCDQSPRPLREVNPAIPRDLSNLVAKLHARAPGDRPQSAGEVAAELADLLARYADPADPANAELRPMHRIGLRTKIAAAACLFVALALGAAEATGVTDVRGTVVRLLTKEVTLVIEVDDPAVSVTLEGTDIIITGTGAQEIRLKPGAYQLSASRDGKLLRQELVNVSRDGRRVVRISRESQSSPDDAGAWERRVTALSPDEQVAVVVEKLKELNPGYDGYVRWTTKPGYVYTVDIVSDEIRDLSPVRVFSRLASLGILGTAPGKGKVKDLRPLRGLPLTFLMLANQQVSDLEPARGMPVNVLIITNNPVEDLSPVQGMPLRSLQMQRTRVKSLEPLRGMTLQSIDLHGVDGVKDLSPLAGMPLNYLNVSFLPVDNDDLRVISGLTGLKMLVFERSPLPDLSFLSSLRLDQLSLRGIPVDDIRPLAKMPLERIHLEYRPQFAEILRSIKTLKMINGKPLDEFWRDVDASRGR